MFDLKQGDSKMQIEEQIVRHKDSILKKWQQAIIDTYPTGAGNYLLENKNKFTNPIGYTIEKSLPAILNAVIEGNLTGLAKESIDDIIRIRAVQEFEPAEALTFLYSLKAVIISLLSDDAELSAFLQIESIFNEINNYGINTYVRFREKIYDIKANEQLRTFEKMIERLNKKYEELTSFN
jgi:hypothetical protein